MKLILIPLLAALTQTASILLAKVGLTRRRISVKDYIPGLFLFLALFSLLTLPKLGHLDIMAFTTPDLLRLLAIGVVAALWNVLYYIGLSREKVNTAEGIMILMPLATIVMSWVFNPQNFNYPIAVAAFAATAIIIWAYHSKKLFHPDKYAVMLSIAVVLIALENVLVSDMLRTGLISPATLYTIRTLIVFVVLYLYYRPSFKRLKPKTMGFLAVSGIIGATTMLLRFYGLRDVGITLTAFILILVPVLVFSSAAILLHERIKRRRIIAVLIVGLLIAFATLANYQAVVGR